MNILNSNNINPKFCSDRMVNVYECYDVCVSESLVNRVMSDIAVYSLTSPAVRKKLEIC
jgi:hypothetical protein